MNPSNTFNFWTPHLSWPAGARVVARGVPAAAQMRGRRAGAGAGAGRGRGHLQRRVQRGVLPKFGTMWGNFPYFPAGVFLCGRDVLRDEGRPGHSGPPAGAAAATAATVTACFFGYDRRDVLRRVAVGGGDAPYGDSFFVDAETPSGTSSGTSGVGRRLCSASRRFLSVAVGACFLASGRAARFRLCQMGARTMYGYLLHAPVLLAVLASAGTFAKWFRPGLSAAAFIAAGSLLPVAVTVACMTTPAVWAFRWLCEPEFGSWLWREATEPGTPGSVTSQGSGK